MDAVSIGDRFAILIGIVVLTFAGIGVLAVYLAHVDSQHTETVIELEARFEAAPPGTIVLGRDLDARVRWDALDRADAGLPSPVHRVDIGGSPAHWYAVLKNRVFANGYRPSLVVGVASLDVLRSNAVTGRWAQATLVEQLGPFEPVIAARSFHTRSHGLWPIRMTTAWFRTRGTLPSLPDTLAPSTPVVSISESYLVDIAALCRVHGARLVWLVAPSSPVVQWSEDLQALGIDVIDFSSPWLHDDQMEKTRMIWTRTLVEIVFGTQLVPDEIDAPARVLGGMWPSDVRLKPKSQPPAG